MKNTYLHVIENMKILKQLRTKQDYVEIINIMYKSNDSDFSISIEIDENSEDNIQLKFFWD